MRSPDKPVRLGTGPVPWPSGQGVARCPRVLPFGKNPYRGKTLCWPKGKLRTDGAMQCSTMVCDAPHCNHLTDEEIALLLRWLEAERQRLLAMRAWNRSHAE